MAKVKTPPRNQVEFSVERPFSAEGFHKLDVIGAFSEIGYSKAETRRLLCAGAIKIWDTRVQPDQRHFEWYKRPAQAFELIEPEEVLFFGKRWFVIEPSPVQIYKRFYWWVRPHIERFIEHFNKSSQGYDA